RRRAESRPQSATAAPGRFVRMRHARSPALRPLLQRGAEIVGEGVTSGSPCWSLPPHEPDRSAGNAYDSSLYHVLSLSKRARRPAGMPRSFRVAERPRPIHIRIMTMTLMHSGEAGRFASDDARWEAVCRRDRSADGAFYCAVVTTGVYCRPSCAA